MSTSICRVALVCAGILGVMLMPGGETGFSAWASPGRDLFQGFRQHIHAQIVKDKWAFSVADTCTTWFYQHEKKPRRPDAEGVESLRLISNQPMDPNYECTKRYPGGLVAAREGFGKAQQELSLSLTFYQMVLVGDGDDNGEYNLQETRDLVESLGLPFFSQQPVTHYLAQLNGIFDEMREKVRFTHLMEGMQALMDKGYRFTEADQARLNEELQ